MTSSTVFSFRSSLEVSNVQGSSLKSKGSSIEDSFKDSRPYAEVSIAAIHRHLSDTSLGDTSPLMRCIADLQFSEFGPNAAFTNLDFPVDSLAGFRRTTYQIEGLDVTYLPASTDESLD